MPTVLFSFLYLNHKLTVGGNRQPDQRAKK